MSDALMQNTLKAWAFLYRHGFIEGFGHLSARLPGGRFMVARHSLGPKAKPEDFVVLDMDGKKLEGKGDPPAESAIHLAILRVRPDVNSVIHYHGMYSTSFTTSEETLRPIHLMGTLFHDGIPVYPDVKLVREPDRGAALAKTLGSHRAVLMRGHGATIVGPNVEDCVAAAFLFEENAHRAILSATLGKPQWIDEQTAAEAGAELIKGRGPFKRVWAMVESEHEQFGSSDH
jgi:ribulose-5-phosphate 4-epimerase/fuculose-1-phosphate aldolase